MSARQSIGVRAAAKRTAFGTAACLFAMTLGAAAQPPPSAPVAPATPPGAAPPPADAPPPAPGAEPPLPPPAEPTAPAEPPPVAESPLLEESPPPPPPPPEDEPSDGGGSAGPFSRGSVRLTLLIGTGSTVTDTYLILGGGPGYFLADGLEIGLDYEGWFLGDPVFHRVSPETRYIFHMVPVVKPYVGVFYRHTFVTGGYEDFDTVGARGGLYIVPKGGRMYLGGGAVYERLLGCDDGSLVECDDVYPEIFFGISI